MFEFKDVNVDEIIVEDRIRYEDTDVADLMYSIEEQGLLNPIIIDENKKLLAGGRRLKAHIELGRDKILARELPGLTEEDHFIIELVENTMRRDFTWIEELSLKGKIHKHFEATQGKDWTYTATAEKLGTSKATLSTDLSILEAVTAFPQLATYQTKGKAREAYKKLVKQAEAVNHMKNLSVEDQAELDSMLAMHLNDEDEPAGMKVPLSANALNNAVNQDCGPGNEAPVDKPNKIPKHSYADICCVEFMESLPDKSVGFMELDPPYAMNYDTVYGATQNIKTTLVDWEPDEYRKKMVSLVNLMPQKLMPDSFVLVWTAVEWIDFLQELFHDHKFKIQKPGIWVKQGGSSNTPYTNLISNYEAYLVFRWGDARFRTESLAGAFNANNVSGKDKMHPTEKPVDGVYDRFFKAMAKPNTIFAAPFAGSGNSMLAAALSGMIPMGTDLSRNQYYPYFLKNLKEATNGQG